MQWRRAMSKIILMTRTGNDTKADDMRAGTTIDDKGLEEEVDSSGITTSDHVQTILTRTELTLNSVRIVG